MTREEMLKQFDLLPQDAKRTVEEFISRMRKRYARNGEKVTETRKPLSEEKFVGMWVDRDEMADSAKWVRNLRKSQWEQRRDR